MEITRDDLLEDVITRWPDTVEVFTRFGMPCFVCGEPAWGTVGELIERHHVKQPEKLLEELNKTAKGTKGNG